MIAHRLLGELLVVRFGLDHLFMDRGTRRHHYQVQPASLPSSVNLFAPHLLVDGTLHAREYKPGHRLAFRVSDSTSNRRTAPEHALRRWGEKFLLPSPEEACDQLHFTTVWEEIRNLFGARTDAFERFWRNSRREDPSVAKRRAKNACDAYDRAVERQAAMVAIRELFADDERFAAFKRAHAYDLPVGVHTQALKWLSRHHSPQKGGVDGNPSASYHPRHGGSHG